MLVNSPTTDSLYDYLLNSLEIVHSNRLHTFQSGIENLGCGPSSTYLTFKPLSAHNHSAPDWLVNLSTIFTRSTERNRSTFTVMWWLSRGSSQEI